MRPMLFGSVSRALFLKRRHGLPFLFEMAYLESIMNPLSPKIRLSTLQACLDIFATVSIGLGSVSEPQPPFYHILCI